MARTSSAAGFSASVPHQRRRCLSMALARKHRRITLDWRTARIPTRMADLTSCGSRRAYPNPRSAMREPYFCRCVHGIRHVLAAHLFFSKLVLRHPRISLRAGLKPSVNFDRSYIDAAVCIVTTQKRILYYPTTGD